MINSTIANDRPRREAAATEIFLGAPNEESFVELFLTLTPQLVSYFRSHGCASDGPGRVRVAEICNSPAKSRRIR